MTASEIGFAEAQRRIASLGEDDELNLFGLNLVRLPDLPEHILILHCDRNQLTSLPKLPDSLVFLSCDNNQLRVLPKLPNLLYLSCNNNQLTSLPSLPSKLEELHCSYNRLTTLPDLPMSLTEIDISNNPLREPFTTVEGTRAYYAEIRRRGRNVSSLRVALGKEENLSNPFKRSGREDLIGSFLTGKSSFLPLRNQSSALKRNYNRRLAGLPLLNEEEVNLEARAGNAAGAGAPRKGGRRKGTRKNKRKGTRKGTRRTR